MEDNYTIDHDTYLMNHKNGDVPKVTVNNKDKLLENLQPYRQDGLENYYYDKSSQLKHQDNLATKKDIVKASKEIGARNAHHTDKWHYKATPVYNAEHKITDFEPKLALERHAKIKNVGRYLRHLNHHHTNFLFLANKGSLRQPLNYLKDAAYTGRNKEVVTIHRVHKIAK